VAGGRGALVAVEQDQPGGSHVHGQSQQGGDEQQGRVDGELQGGAHEHARDQDHQAHGDGEREHEVDKNRWNGNQHDEQDDNHAAGQQEVALTGEFTVIELNGRCCLRHDFDTLGGGPDG